MEAVKHPLSDHRVSIIEYPSNDKLWHLRCSCGEWEGKASKATKTNLHPEREDDVFAIAVAERHIMQNGVWVYEEDGKPRRVRRENDGTTIIEVVHKWPYGE